MITPVGDKPILAIMPTRAVSQLKGMSSIDSFTFGKQNLRPAIVELFKRQGIEIKDIYLDNPAKVRLMGMMPSFESLVAEGKTVEEIFAKLELSLFLSESGTGAQNLYVLGDLENLRGIKAEIDKSAMVKANGTDNVEQIEAVILADQIGIKMITIPAGEFIFQGVPGVRHNGFKIAETEFTNRQFEKLIELKPKELAKIVENPWERLKKSLLEVHPDHRDEAEDCPMGGLSQKEFDRIAELLGLRLLTELEWERAAAGKEGRKYSFGNQFDQSKVTFNEKGIRSVYAHRDAATPEGVLDLCGNVWEFTDSDWHCMFKFDPKNPKFPESGDGEVVVRGGTLRDGCKVDLLRASDRYKAPAKSRNYYTGARFADDFPISNSSQIKIPEMIDIPGSSSRIMKGEVTIDLFKRVMRGYEIIGDKAATLDDILTRPKSKKNPLTYVSLIDAKEFAKRLSALTGRRFRVPTEQEWIAANTMLFGNNYTWTTTKEKKDGSRFVLRHLSYGLRFNLPDVRYSDIAIRLVEDL